MDARTYIQKYTQSVVTNMLSINSKGLFSIFAAAVLTACATTTSTPFTGPDPEQIFEVSSDAAGIYQGSRQWITENFKSANDVIQYQDESTATVIG